MYIYGIFCNFCDYPIFALFAIKIFNRQNLYPLLVGRILFNCKTKNDANKKDVLLANDRKFYDTRKKSDIRFQSRALLKFIKNYVKESRTRIYLSNFMSSKVRTD